MQQSWRRRARDRVVARLQAVGRGELTWTLRITLVATASYAVALVAFPGTQPLLAPLTAMLVVQVTPVTLLARGLERVIAVVVGVALAVGFASVLPLTWWSLAALIFASLVLGQLLRLRDFLIEVAISGMLVLGVGSLGAEAAAWQRIAETLVGAAVGVLGNLLFPPKPPIADAGDAIDGLADRISALLTGAADDLDGMREAPDGPPALRPASSHWLGDARRITHDIPTVGAALLAAEEGRRLNVRSARTPHVEAGLRQGLEALEHTAVGVRSLMRSVVDASRGAWLDQPGAGDVLAELAQTLRQLSVGIDAFGELVRKQGDVETSPNPDDVTRLQDALAGMHDAIGRLDAALESGPDPDVRELHTFERLTVRRLLTELDLEERVRRQLRLARPRKRMPRPPRRRPRADLWEPTGPDDETRPLPRIPPEDV